MPETAKINQRFADSVRCSKDRSELKVFDSEVKGFGVRVRSTGSRTYFIQYRNRHGRTRRLSLGNCRTVTAEAARSRAKALLGEVAGGNDPLEQKQLDRQRADTFRELCDLYIESLDQPGRSPAGLKESRRLVERQLVPVFGSRPWRDISPYDARALHRKLKVTPVEANRVVSRLSTILNYGQRLAPDATWANPCATITPYPEKRRERFLSDEELRRLGKALAEAERDPNGPSPIAIAAIKVLVLTGARLREILHLTWDAVDETHYCLRLKTSKTGQKVIPISHAALEIIRGLPREAGSPWVFPGGRAGRPLGNLWRPWKNICHRTSLTDVRLHDLRHSFASIGVSNGLSLPIIGAALGHRSPTTTQRYAHLADNPVRKGVESTSRCIADLLEAP